MRSLICAFAAFLSCIPLAAQAAPDQVQTSDIGFSYSVPSDWTIQITPAQVAAAREKAAQQATSADEKKGANCTQVELAARHGSPSSVIVVVSLPYSCYGQSFTQTDLPTFGKGVSQGIASSFTLGPEQTATYTLGTHKLWVDRAPGSPKDDPTQHYTIEVSCVLLNKGAVCWMAMAVDSSALAVFEHGAVTLENDPPASLVPAGVLTN